MMYTLSILMTKPLLDVIILPLAGLLYLSAYLDRGNLGNARLQGLESDVLNGDSEKYSLALACFYISMSHPPCPCFVSPTLTKVWP